MEDQRMRTIQTAIVIELIVQLNLTTGIVGLVTPMQRLRSSRHSFQTMMSMATVQTSTVTITP